MIKLCNINNLKINLILIICSITVTLFLVIGGRYIQDGYNIEIGDVSPKTFRATRLIEDNITTEKLKNEARNSVGVLYKKDSNIVDSINKKINDFFMNIDELRLMYYEENKKNNFNLQENNIQMSILENLLSIQNKTSSLKLNKEQMLILLNLDNTIYFKFKDVIFITFKNIMEGGIRELSEINWESKIYPIFEVLDVDNKLSNLAYDILSYYIEPNIVVDKESIEKAKEEKANEVKPVVYLEGQNVVNQGDIITEEAFYLLESLGFINKGYMGNVIPIMGALALVVVLIILASYYIYSFHKKIYKDNKQMCLLFTLYILTILITRFLTHINYTFVPVLVFTMLVAMLLNNNLALVLNTIVTVITLLIYKGNIDYMIYFLVTGTIISFIVEETVRRNKIMLIAVIISIISSIWFLSVTLFVEKNYSSEILMKVSYAFVSGFLTVIICMGTLPFWEVVFGVITPFKLLDLTNPNNELLRRLSIEAPGTYHHSIIVANLAETAACNINANPNIAKVGGYYHDIGKLKYPNYFSENQIGKNPHDEMDPLKSAEVIKSHVEYGLELADEKKLPLIIRDIIEQHQGTTKIKYFYHKAQKEYGEEEIDENDFRYTYRKPQFKESAIVMLADTVEAAVRSMVSRSKSLSEVEDFVRILIKDKLDDGQLIDSELYIKDIDIIIESFMTVFKGMYHERIPYPDEINYKKK